MVISGVAHVAKELSEDAAAPPTDKTLQRGVCVGARDAEEFEAGLGLGDDILAGGGVQPVAGDGEVEVADLRVGSNQGIAVPPVQHGQDLAEEDVGKGGGRHRMNVVRLKVG